MRATLALPAHHLPAFYLILRKKCKTLFRILKEMKPHFKHMKRRGETDPPTMSFTMTLYETMIPRTSFSTPSLTLKRKKRLKASFFKNPNWASAFGADWLLTCSRRPGWCLHASVCHPERCPSSPCCWPAEAASCRLSAASLQETPSPWQERTDKL